MKFYYKIHYFKSKYNVMKKQRSTNYKVWEKPFKKENGYKFYRKTFTDEPNPYQGVIRNCNILIIFQASV